MTVVIRAELQRLGRPRTLLAAAGASLLFAVVATVAVFSSAPATGPVGPQGGTTLELLGRDGGGTEAFATGASFLGFLVFVTFIALVAGEFTGGTFRAVLVRNPRRLQVIVGKLTGALLLAAAMVALAELASFALSLLLGPANDVPTSAWFTLGSAVAGVGDFGAAFAGVAGWAVFGTTLAVVFRSTPLALGVGFAWAGPFENITVDSWETGLRVFPGQVLRAVIDGGTPQLGLGRAALTGAVYVALAAAVTALLLTRRDITT